MTKQQPCASKLPLSKICRWLIVLGVAKLALFGAWSADLPLPSFFADEQASSTVPSASVSGPARPPAEAAATASVPAGGDVRLAALFAERAAPADVKAPVEKPVPAPAAAEKHSSPDPAGGASSAPASDEALVRSAAPLPSMPVALLPWSKELRVEAETLAADAGERPLASGVDNAADAAAPAAREADETWWSGIMSLTRHLPVPMLGARQVAHAAAMDMPAPSRPSTPSASPFAPPEQSRVQSPAPLPGPAADGAPLPLRPRSPQAQAPAPRGGGAPAPAAFGARALPTPSAKPGLSSDSPERMQQELARREQEVLMLKQQMESRLQELQSTEKKVQGMLKEAHGVHDQKIKHLITAYTNMKPKQAALALESLDERLAVRILAGMNPKQAGEMLTYTNPQTVAKLSELMARMQLPGE